MMSKDPNFIGFYVRSASCGPDAPKVRLGVAARTVLSSEFAIKPANAATVHRDMTAVVRGAHLARDSPPGTGIWCDATSEPRGCMMEAECSYTVPSMVVETYENLTSAPDGRMPPPMPVKINTTTDAFLVAVPFAHAAEFARGPIGKTKAPYGSIPDDITDEALKRDLDTFNQPRYGERSWATFLVPPDMVTPAPYFTLNFDIFSANVLARGEQYATIVDIKLHVVYEDRRDPQVVRHVAQAGIKYQLQQLNIADTELLDLFGGLKQGDTDASQQQMFFAASVIYKAATALGIKLSATSSSKSFYRAFLDDTDYTDNEAAVFGKDPLAKASLALAWFHETDVTEIEGFVGQLASAIEDSRSQLDWDVAHRK